MPERSRWPVAIPRSRLRQRSPLRHRLVLQRQHLPTCTQAAILPKQRRDGDESLPRWIHRHRNAHAPKRLHRPVRVSNLAKLAKSSVNMRASDPSRGVAQRADSSRAQTTGTAEASQPARSPVAITNLAALEHGQCCATGFDHCTSCACVAAALSVTASHSTTGIIDQFHSSVSGDA